MSNPVAVIAWRGHRRTVPRRPPTNRRERPGAVRWSAVTIHALRSRRAHVPAAIRFVVVTGVAALIGAGCSSSGSVVDVDLYRCPTKPVVVPQPTNPLPATATVGNVTVNGSPLPKLPESGKDPAIGCAAPVIDGQSFDGRPIRIGGGGVDGRPTVVIAAAHWCPHCNKELPEIQAAVHGGSAGMRYVVVSTAVSSRSPNYPPGPWLTDTMGWTGGVMADDASSTAAKALGVTAFPMYVFIDAQGEVVERFTGETATDTLVDKANHLAAVSIEGGLHGHKDAS